MYQAYSDRDTVIELIVDKDWQLPFPVIKRRETELLALPVLESGYEVLQ